MYIPPVFEIVLVEMEAGISATSALVKPDTTVQTDWEGTDTQTGKLFGNSLILSLEPAYRAVMIIPML